MIFIDEIPILENTGYRLLRRYATIWAAEKGGRERAHDRCNPQRNEGYLARHRRLA
jgi:hypothetical protein